MFDIPTRASILCYGPKMINVECPPVASDEYDLLSPLSTFMTEVMKNHNGIGLAAPQIGVFRQFFVMRTDSGKVIDVVNPIVVQAYGYEIKQFEACLSLPPVGNGSHIVPRLEHIHLRCGSSIDPESESLLRLRGMDARVAQHELDHLTGTFFVDRIAEKPRAEVMKSFEHWRTNQCRKPYLTSRP